MRRLASNFLDKPGVTLPDGTAIFVIGMPDLAAVHAAAAATVNSPGKTVLAVMLAALLSSPLQFQLHLFVNLVADNGRMAVFNVVLRHFALVDFHLLG